jgi:long-chain acyl-CoA synthetase
MSGRDAVSAIQDYADRPFGTFAELFALQAAAHPDKTAAICGDRAISYRDLDARADRIAAALQRDGVKPGGVAAICAPASIDYVAVFIGTLRTGAAIAPLSPSATAEQLAGMIADCGANHVFTDAGVSAHLAPVADGIGADFVALTDGARGTPLADWLAPEGARPAPVEITPEMAFNIIYSSGTTGTPKGIVQSHRMRWPHNQLTTPPGLGPDAVGLVSTPLYSNTTLVAFLPALAGGGTVVLMPKFDARGFLELADRHRATHAMLVPVQYQRILAVEDFDAFDLSAFRLKYCTSAPFSAELKAEVLRRWPGGLIEFYGMTEGGGSCVLVAHEHPDKLHTVGKAMPGHDIRVIGPDGAELPPGEVGEVVGRSGSMMTGYHGRPDKTREAEWVSPEGERFIRTGDLAKRDADGFFTIVGRAKDMIISGGMNIYPADLEAVLTAHAAVADASVVGMPSKDWGETPVGFVCLTAPDAVTPEALLAWANAQLGKMQRLADIRIVDELPRSAIGKVLKRELQAGYDAAG